MAKVPRAEGYFCIDSTEVTNAQYQAFLTLGTSAAQQSACSTNSTYTPQSGSDCPNLSHYDPSGRPNFPVSCIDWCDAYMYCQEAGKRLCGAIEGDAVPWGSNTNHTMSQWDNACSLGGSRAYQYGSTYMSGRCNDVSSPVTGPAQVAISFPTCTSNWPGEASMYDLSGNVQEWENSCSGSDTASNCAARGGDWLGTGTAMSCDASVSVPRMTRSQKRGFRCCWDPSMP